MSDKIFVSCFHVPNTFDFQTIYSSQILKIIHELSWKLILTINAMFSFNLIVLFYESRTWCLIYTFTKSYCQYHFTTKPFLPLFQVMVLLTVLKAHICKSLETHIWFCRFMRGSLFFKLNLNLNSTLSSLFFNEQKEENSLYFESRELT